MQNIVTRAEMRIGKFQQKKELYDESEGHGAKAEPLIDSGISEQQIAYYRTGLFLQQPRKILEKLPSYRPRKELSDYNTERKQDLSEQGLKLEECASTYLVSTNKLRSKTPASQLENMQATEHIADTNSESDERVHTNSKLVSCLPEDLSAAKTIDDEIDKLSLKDDALFAPKETRYESVETPLLSNFSVDNPDSKLTPSSDIDNACEKDAWQDASRGKRNKDRKHVCTICLRKFVALSTLKSHLRTHTGENPFKCSVCEKAFSQQLNLKNHMIVHSGEKPLEYPECSRTFDSQSAVKSHFRTHT